MTTLNQLTKKARIPKQKLYSKKGLNKCPQKLAICNKIRIMAPKKPNSAQRQVARVKVVSTNQFLTVYIPGEGHNLQQFSNVLIRGGRVRDLPGIRYKIIRGNRDAKATAENNRNQRRSKFGIPKPKEKINIKITTKKS